MLCAYSTVCTFIYPELLTKKKHEEKFIDPETTIVESVAELEPVVANPVTLTLLPCYPNPVTLLPQLCFYYKHCMCLCMTGKLLQA